MSRMFEVLHYAAMPDWRVVRGLRIKRVPECESDGFAIHADQAHLIAAAPDMLKALDRLVSTAEAYLADLPDTAYAARVVTADRISAARAAIAKARGES